jgi:hypothetical protein
LSGHVGETPVVDDSVIVTGDVLKVHASSFDADDNYITDENVNWSLSGGIGLLSKVSGDSTTLTATTAGTGQITADHALLIDDATGTITVSIGTISYIKIVSKAGGPLAGAEDINDTTITADQVLHLYAAGFDVGNNYLGEFSVNWSSLGLDPEVNIPNESHIIFSPQKAQPGNISVTYPGATGDQTGTITVTPGVPTGMITLTPVPPVLPADNISLSTITSDVIFDSDSNAVAIGSLVTIITNLGDITTPDASPEFNDIQIEVDAEGKISFTLKAGSVGGKANLFASSVNGSAKPIYLLPV